MIALQPGFLKYHQDKTTAKDGPRIGASPTGRVKKSVVHAPKEPKAIHAMPVVAVIGAIASFSAGAAVVAGGIGAIAAGSVAAMVVGGAMMVGAALTVVGVVTGNEKLTKIGGILSLAGGIGAGVAGLMGAAGGAGAAGATAGLEGAVPMAEMAGPSVASEVGGAANTAATTAAVTANDTSGILNMGGGPGELASAGDVAQQSLQTPVVTDAATQSAVGANPTNSYATIAPDAYKTTGGLDPYEVDGILTDKTTVLNKPQGGGILDWMNKNKQATELLSGAVSGAAKMVPTAKDKALLEQAKANTALTNEQIEQARRRAAYGQGKLYTKGG